MGFSSLDMAFRMALDYRSRAFAPYSKFSVGSVVKFVGSDKLYGGCNVENASFGASICAERVAIWKALSEDGKSKIDCVLVVTNSETFDPPCGNCLQVMNEFSDQDTEIVLANRKGVQKIVKFFDLLPVRFDGFAQD